VFFFSFSWTFVSGTVSPVLEVVAVVSFDVAVVDAVAVDFLLPLVSAFADFVVFAGLAALVVDLTGFAAVAFTGFGGLLGDLTETGLTVVVVDLTGLDTDACVGFGGLTDFGFGPPWLPASGADISRTAQSTVSTRRFMTPPR
jgi:hypothetical protein